MASCDEKMDDEKEEAFCIVCKDAMVYENKTRCCKQPIHHKCLSEWNKNRVRVRASIQCCYCRRQLPPEIQSSIRRWYRRILDKETEDDFTKDHMFMEEVRRVWGNRPIWCNNDKHFYGTIWDFEMGRFRFFF